MTDAVNSRSENWFKIDILPNKDMAKRELKSKKCELIDCLSSDSDYILQKIDSKEMLFLHEYQALKYQLNPVKRITDLLDLILGKGEKKCEEFIHALQEVQDTYPQLKYLVANSNKSPDDQCSIAAMEEDYPLVVKQPQLPPDPSGIKPKKKFKESFPIHGGQVSTAQDETNFGMFSCLMDCMRTVTFRKL
ncbi:hypothetical protein chiPu_0001831 [Chiloscyllium punctatum]|uniref:CARD domain-containing protein n=1 Tax=Chiloscyllium punctatum TaxID=137246 RepID=A0A401RZ60_CHIPU|nr:hypothetical protein [Chiloscyllium punctatum]